MTPVATATVLAFVILGCTASAEELQRRLVARQQGESDSSGADIEAMQRQRRTVEAPAGDELDWLLEVHPGWNANRLWRGFAERFDETAAERDP